VQATTVVQALALVLGMTWGALRPREAGRALLPRDFWINVATGAMLFPVRVLLTAAGLYSLNVGLVPLGTLGHPVVQFLFCFLVLDFAKYWVHYADHRVPWLWRFHRVHHSTEHLDASAGLRMHVVDFLQLSAIPITLFGVVFDISNFESWVFPASLSVGIVADSLEHMNVRMTLDTPIERLWYAAFNSPLFHSWHHVRDGHLCDGNYANALPLWDRLFGTDVARDVPPELYGVAKGSLEDSFLGLHLLRPRRPELDGSPGSAG
jgi:sterol desaturase/sphingolipid hydroxylase (fatty acid hydroxylase superfamily)